MQVEVLEILKITADPVVLNDVDKLKIVLKVDGGEERRVTIAAPANLETQADLETALQTAIAATKPKPTITNLTDKWRGVYTLT